MPNIMPALSAGPYSGELSRKPKIKSNNESQSKLVIVAVM